MICLQLFSGWKGLAEVWNSKEIKGNGIPLENLVPNNDLPFFLVVYAEEW